MAKHKKTLEFPADGNSTLYTKTVVLEQYHGGSDIRMTSKSVANPGWAGSFSDANMQALRDALLEMYPLPLPKDAEPAHTADPAKRKRWRGKQEYKGNGKHVWEVVLPAVYHDESIAISMGTLRLRVPGGWLYKNADAMTFVPMPDVPGSYPV